MANQIIGEQYGRTGRLSYNESSRVPEFRHMVTYVVRMDSATATDNEVLAVSGIPRLGEQSPIATGCYCIDVDAKEEDTRTWHVKATFSTPTRNGSINGLIPDGQPPSNQSPWNKPPKWSWDSENQEDVLLVDAIDGVPIANSAGEQLAPSTYPVALPVLRVQIAKLVFDGSEVLEYVNYVNSTSFWGAPAKHALMAGITARQGNHNGQRFWEVEYTIKFHPHSWTLKPLDHGTYYYEAPGPPSGELKYFSGEAMQPILGNLNGLGGEASGSNVVFLEYNRYPEKDFSPLNLGPFN